MSTGDPATTKKLREVTVPLNETGTSSMEPRQVVFCPLAIVIFVEVGFRNRESFDATDAFMTLGIGPESEKALICVP